MSLTSYANNNLFKTKKNPMTTFFLSYFLWTNDKLKKVIRRKCVKTKISYELLLYYLAIFHPSLFYLRKISLPTPNLFSNVCIQHHREILTNICWKPFVLLLNYNYYYCNDYIFFIYIIKCCHFYFYLK